MKKTLYTLAIVAIQVIIPIILFGQTPPNIGTAGSFVLFSSSGAVTNVGNSQITGNVGTNSGACSGFGNVNGKMHVADGVSASAATDLNLAYTDLGSQAPTIILGVAIGKGQVLTPAVFAISAASTLRGSLTLDGQGDPNACFIFQLGGAFSADSIYTINLINGAKSCNVFWRIDGATNIIEGTTFKGTIVCNGAILLKAGVKLEGRALSVLGAIGGTTITAAISNGCGSLILTGPSSPDIGTTACFALLTADGALTNTGTTTIDGEIGTNNGALTGFDPLLVTTIHPVSNEPTVQACTDLNVLYTYLNGLPCEIELLYPVQFGNSQVLTPHVYCLSAATHLTDTIFLDARGNTNAVFVFQINGAFTTSSYSNVVLLGGAQSKNVFWKVEGAVDINDNSNFKGTIVANNGAISILNGVTLVGNAFSTTGAVTINDANITSVCNIPLPVEISSFEGYISGSESTLTWTTVGNAMSDYFIMEESADMKNWDILAAIDGNNSNNILSSYNVIDFELSSNCNYYRLKQVGMNNTYQYSKIINLKNKLPQNELTVSVYPNPTTDIVSFNLSVNESSFIQIEIMDMKGRVVSTQNGKTDIGLSIFTTSLENLPKGIYLVKITSNQKISTSYLAKQ